MIIIEQDKTYFVNFNNVSQVTLAVNKEEEEYAVMVQTIDEEELIMGIYKTEEREKEVLEEIIEKYEHVKDCECDRIYFNTLENFTYKMPKE